MNRPEEEPGELRIDAIASDSVLQQAHAEDLTRRTPVETNFRPIPRASVERNRVSSVGFRFQPFPGRHGGLFGRMQIAWLTELTLPTELRRTWWLTSPEAA